MSTSVRVATFVAALAAVFAAALGLGRLVGPLDVAAAPAHEGGAGHGEAGHGDAGHSDATGSAPAAESAADSGAELPGGLQVSAAGHTLALDEPTLAAGESVPLRFRVLGPDGAPLTSYDVEHEKELHLIVVRRDLTGFQHVHPTRDADGTWVTDVALDPGSWRVLADFTPAGGDGITLGADLSVPGPYRPAGPAPEKRTDTVDGYTVTLTGDLAPGGSSGLSATVTRDGEEVTDLEPYLGAYGHLVALREGDLAYLHVHPEDGGPGPDVPFAVDVPSEGDYRLFFDFQHDGVVRTAELAVSTDPDQQDEQDDAAPEEHEEDESHDH